MHILLLTFSIFRTTVTSQLSLGLVITMQHTQTFIVQFVAILAYTVSLFTAILAQGNVPNDFFAVQVLNAGPQVLIIPLDNNGSTDYIYSGKVQLFSEYGLRLAELSAANGDGEVGCSALLFRTSGNENSGNYYFSCKFSSKWRSYGDYFLSLDLTDLKGNKVHFNYLDLQAFQKMTGMLIISVFEVIAQPEYEPPVLTAMTLSADKFIVDTKTGQIDPPQLTVTLRIKDDVGIYGASLAIGGGQQPLACAGLTFHYSSNFVNGSYTDAVYESSCDMFVGGSIPVPYGNYSFFIAMNDCLGNSIDLHAGDLQAMGFPYQITYVKN